MGWEVHPAVARRAADDAARPLPRSRATSSPRTARRCPTPIVVDGRIIDDDRIEYFAVTSPRCTRPSRTVSRSRATSRGRCSTTSSGRTATDRTSARRGRSDHVRTAAQAERTLVRRRLPRTGEISPDRRPDETREHVSSAAAPPRAWRNTRLDLASAGWMRSSRRLEQLSDATSAGHRSRLRAHRPAGGRSDRRPVPRRQRDALDVGRRSRLASTPRRSRDRPTCAARPRVDLALRWPRHACHVTLNGTPVGETANMHRRYRFDVGPSLRDRRRQRC